MGSRSRAILLGLRALSQVAAFGQQWPAVGSAAAAAVAAAPHARMAAGAFATHAAPSKRLGLADVNHIIAVASGKGGVGKSTVAGAIQAAVPTGLAACRSKRCCSTAASFCQSLPLLLIKPNFGLLCIGS